jgi:hypothetical protein
VEVAQTVALIKILEAGGDGRRRGCFGKEGEAAGEEGQDAGMEAELEQGLPILHL